MTSPNGEMGIVTNLLLGFQQYQRNHSYRDDSNMIQNKWDMRDVYRHVGDLKETRKLIRFFMLYSDDKSFQAFFRNYADYWQTMKEVRVERAASKELRRQTLEKVIESKETT